MSHWESEGEMRYTQNVLSFVLFFKITNANTIKC